MTALSSQAMEMQEAVRKFFSQPRFAVAGASQDVTKFGHKVFAWYLQRSLPVTALNPRQASISALGQEHTTLPSPSKLPEPAQTGLSFVTPPGVTLHLLKEAKNAGVPAVFLQPGTFNDEVMKYAKQEFEAVIGGYDGLVPSSGLNQPRGEGWCVLLHGAWGLGLAGRLKDGEGKL